MIKEIKTIINTYLEIFPLEKDRIKLLIDYLENNSYEDLTNWNNFDAHFVSGGFIYAQKEQKFLVLYHKDLKMYLYPGGHVNQNEDVFASALREVGEETGLNDLKLIKICPNKKVPIDIDIQHIKENKTLGLPFHIHFDFRYLFVIESIKMVYPDYSEASGYKWITSEEFIKMPFKGVLPKIKNLLEKKEA